MDDFDWIFVFFVAATLGVAALLWLYLSRAKPPTFPDEWVCDGCGQLCGDLKDGLCEYCDETLKPLQKP